MMMVTQPCPPTTTFGKLSPPLSQSNPSLFQYRRKHRFSTNYHKTSRKNPITIVNSSDTKVVGSKASETGAEINVVGEENVPVEGVIQFDKPESNNFQKWRYMHYARWDKMNLVDCRKHRFSTNYNKTFRNSTITTVAKSDTKVVPLEDVGENNFEVVGEENVPAEGVYVTYMYMGLFGSSFSLSILLKKDEGVIQFDYQGVIQFDKPKFINFTKWSRIALLAGGDVLALLLFSSIGRFSHGFSVFDAETLRTADPFMAGWFLSAYFLGGYGEDGRGMNGYSNAVIAAAKSWGLGIPVGVGIRAVTTGHLPPLNFILVTMGSTAVLLIGWRALLYNIFPNDNMSKKDDVYKRGSPFELFGLLTSLIRRW